MQRLLLIFIGFFVAATSVAQQSDSIRTIKNNDEVVVTAERTYSAASDAEFHVRDLSLLPRSSAQDLLRIVPGLFIAQHAGGGKAEQIFLRGFDCDHGTDISISVDDAPVNMVSHGHGQGYADLHFIIPEAIENIDISKGPYFARNGDLSTAGTVTFHTYDALKENLVRIETGTYQYSPEIYRGISTYRAVGLFKAPFESDKISAYFGVELYSNDGYFDLAQQFKRLNLMAKATAALTEESKLSATLFSFNSGWNANGQIPERAVSEGFISRFGSIDSTEGGKTSRTTAIVAYSTDGASPLTVTGSFTDYRFRLYSNFTLFAEDSVRGDEIEQTDKRSIVTLRAENKRSWFSDGALFTNTVGAQFRSDNITVGLFHDSSRIRLETKVDGDIREHQIGLYDEQGISLPWLQLQAGLRADYVHFNVINTLSASGQPSGIAHQVVFSPKLTVALPINEAITIFGNSGYGFHSNDARAVVSTEGTASLPRALGLEVGSRLGKTSDIIYGSIALWQLDLESELVWSGDEGTTEESGRTRRQGIDFDLRINPFEWLFLSTDLTLSRGRFRDLPEGENYIPLAPNITLVASAVVRSGDFSGAVRLRSLDDRPATENNTVTATGYTVFDLSASYRFSNLEVFANIENLFNIEWNEAQFDTGSRLRGEPAGIASEIHFTAGSPRSLRVGLAYHY